MTKLTFATWNISNGGIDGGSDTRLPSHRLDVEVEVPRDCGAGEACPAPSRYFLVAIPYGITSKNISTSKRHILAVGHFRTPVLGLAKLASGIPGGRG
jgi:hypothetical protein